jgi:nitroreductase
MAFQRPVTQIIPGRSSHRTYLEEPLDPDVAAKLREALENPPPPLFGSPVRIALLESFGEQKRGGEKLGTYGFIKGASHFLVGLVPEGDHTLEDFGYVFEWAVLTATDLGLATCWVGGTLKRGAFAKAVGARPEEIVPAISPVGLTPGKRRVFDTALRFFAGSKKRKPWESLFFEGRFGSVLDVGRAEVYRTVLEMVRLAPSASNRQPWRVVKEKKSHRYHLFLQRTAGYRKMTSVDIQRIDMGIALCHFALSAKEVGLSGSFSVREPDMGKLPERTSYVATWNPDGDHD